MNNCSNHTKEVRLIKMSQLHIKKKKMSQLIIHVYVCTFLKKLTKILVIFEPAATILMLDFQVSSRGHHLPDLVHEK